MAIAFGASLPRVEGLPVDLEEVEEVVALHKSPSSA